MSRRERKSDRQSWAPSIIEEARKLVHEGKSKRFVAISLGIPESTLRRLLKKTVCPTKLGRYDKTFSTEIEKAFCDYLMTLDAMFFGMTTKDLRGLAYEFAEKNNIAHRFNSETKIAGKEWLRGFLKRHPDLSIRQPTSTSIARAVGFNRPQCERFYINLSALLDKYNFACHRIYNMDETGISTVPNRPPKVLTAKGKRAVNKIASAERGTNVTVVNAMSASGHFVPPAFIFGRKRMKAELLDGSPAGSIGMISDSSFINTDRFIDWLSHFRDHTKPTENDPILLVLDNHSSHCSIKAVDFFRENNIVALTLPPHSSHKMQPLDRGFHGILKKYYAGECEKWLRSHPGRAITVFQLTSIFASAYNRAANIQCAVDSFRVTGIWPWNPDVFSDADFMASSVTEQENPDNILGSSRHPSGQAGTSQDFDSNKQVTEQTTTIDAQSPQSSLCKPSTSTNVDFTETNTTTIDAQSPQSSLCKPSTSTNVDLTETYTTTIDAQSPQSSLCKPSTSTNVDLTEINVTCSNDTSLSDKILNIKPFPKSQTKRSTKRKRMKSEIISSSPYKYQLEAASKQKTEPKPKKPKKSLKASNKCYPEKIWTCPGCQELYKEPAKEDWIECSVCKEWWHDKCTGYLGFGVFKCDLCLP